MDHDPPAPGPAWLSWALAAACAAGIAVVYLGGLGAPLNNSDEAIYAEFVAEMHRSGDYGTLRYQGVQLLERPTTAVTLYALVARVVPGEYGLRLLPALLTWLAALAVGALVWRRTRRLSAALFGLLLCAAIPSVYFYGRLVFTDQLLVLACLGAVAATWAAQRDPRWLPWAGVCLGAGFAVKSLAAAIPAVALAPWLVRALWRHRAEPPTLQKAGGRSATPERRGSSGDSGRRGLLTGAGFLALAAPYYVYNLAAHGERFYREHIARILFDRASGGLESVIGLGGPLAYAEHLVRTDRAAGVLVVVAVVGAAVLAWRRRDELAGVAATFAVVVFAALSLVGTRLAHYLLVFYPVAALCAGLVAAEILTLATERDRCSRLTRLAFSALAPALGLALFAQTLAGPPVDPAMSPSPAARDVGTSAARHARPGEPVYTFDWYAPAVGYYAGRPWRLASSVAGITRALQNTHPFRYTDTVIAVPPWPPGDLLVAGDRTRLFRSPDLAIVERLADHGAWVLVRARAVSPAPATPR